MNLPLFYVPLACMSANLSVFAMPFFLLRTRLTLILISCILPASYISACLFMMFTIPYLVIQLGSSFISQSFVPGSLLALIDRIQRLFFSLAGLSYQRACFANKNAPGNCQGRSISWYHPFSPAFAGLINSVSNICLTPSAISQRLRRA